MFAPVEVIDDFTDNHFDVLWNRLPFVRRDNTPRLECWMNDYGTPYTYGSGRGVRTYEPVPYDLLITELRDKINETTDHYMDACFINGYASERDHLGWHADDSPEINDNCAIGIISFGAEREIWFRPKGTKGPHTDSVLMKAGSLVLMAPGMQDEWEHRIPKHSSNCEPRISLTYRGLIV